MANRVEWRRIGEHDASVVAELLGNRGMPPARDANELVDGREELSHFFPNCFGGL